MERVEFAAFLSYSHRDQRWAQWLHRALEAYAVPPRVAGKTGPYGPIPQRLRPIFRDRDELAASADLGERITSALDGARALIVLCSPDAARSRWANEEITTFKRLHPDRPILAAIVAGEPYASDVPGREHEEAFPPALRFRLTPDGALTDDPVEPIAADFRAEADGKRLGKLKLIAGMLGVGLDELVRRDTARRNRRFAGLATASFGGMALTSGLALYALHQRADAVRQRESADGLVEFMLTDLRKKLEPVGRLDVLDSVGEKALRYYGAQDLSSLDADALGRRARALLLVGEVADQRGNASRAMAGFREAARTTGELLQRDPGNWQRVYDHAQSVYWVGYMAGDLGDQRERLQRFEQYAALGQRLLAIDPANRRSQLEAAYGDFNLGAADQAAERFDEALASFERAQNKLERIADRDREIAQSLAEVHAHTSSVLYVMGRTDQALVERTRQIALLTAAPFKSSDKDVQRDIAYARRMSGQLYLVIGDLRSSERLLRQSSDDWQHLVSVDPTNQEWAEGLASTRANLALTSLAQHRRDEARKLASEGAATMERIQRARPNDQNASFALLLAYTAQLLSGDKSVVFHLSNLVSSLREDRNFVISIEHRAHLAGALVILGDVKNEQSTITARKLWNQARDLLSGDHPVYTYGEIQRELIARRLGKAEQLGTPSTDIRIAYGGLFADRIHHE